MLNKKSLFKCPVCSEVLIEGQKQYFCHNGHNFDIARKGYVNLLLPGHTGPGSPGDDKEMIKSRRDFLSKGYYKNFSDALNQIIADEISNINDTKINILDAGCGEGYYTWRLKDALSSLGYGDNINIYGIDVSKPAIHHASGGDRSIHFAVASTYHIPILPGCMDYILCIFAPRDEEEFRHVLKPSGKLIVAAPGARHLLSFKKALYGDAKLIGQKGTVQEGFKLLKAINVSYEIYLKSTSDILNLLTMTPYYRHIEQHMIDNLKSFDELTTEVDFNIMVYQKE